MELAVSTSEVTEVVDVSSRVEGCLPDDVHAGTVTAFVPHTTAGVTINEAEGRLTTDVVDALERIVPSDAEYAHDEIDDNAAAHIRAMLVGESVTVPVEDGTLALGTWQSILFVECDGPRERRLRVVVSGDGES